jgi:hypothetical protein
VFAPSGLVRNQTRTRPKESPQTSDVLPTSIVKAVTRSESSSTKSNSSAHTGRSMFRVSNRTSRPSSQTKYTASPRPASRRYWGSRPCGRSTFSHTSYGPPFPSEVNTLEDPPIDFRSVKEDEIEIDNLLGVYRLDAHEKSLSTNVMGRLIDLYWHKLDNNTLHQRLRSYQGLREILQSLS